jgi:3-methyladenine DNA glycosylase AlkD
MDELIKDIRTRLRQAMNGIVSASMREKGVQYKLNFGTSLADLKAIASRYEPNAQLADWLWEQDVREHKILATLLYPREAFTEEKANDWVNKIRHQEIAEQFCANLMQYRPFAGQLAEEWINEKGEYVNVCGFLLYARLYTQGNSLLASDKWLSKAKTILDRGISRTQRAALIALKRYGRLGKGEATAVLTLLDEYQHSESKEIQEFYNDLKFEFDYYN